MILCFQRQVCMPWKGYQPTPALPTDIERRSQNSYTAPCSSVTSHGAPTEGIWVFADNICGNKRKQNASMIFVHRAVCLSSHSDHSTYAPDESRLV